MALRRSCTAAKAPLTPPRRLPRSANVRHNQQQVFLTDHDVQRIESYDGFNAAAVAELLATDEVRRCTLSAAAL